MPHQDYFDLDVGYAIEDGWFDGLTIRAGVENLTDEPPPIFPSWVDANTDPSQFDVLGRRYYVHAALTPPRVHRRPLVLTDTAVSWNRLILPAMSVGPGALVAHCRCRHPRPAHHPLAREQTGESGAAIAPVSPGVVRPAFSLGALGSGGV